MTAVLEDLGYQPTTTQRVMPGDPVVTVVFDTLVNPYSAQVLRGVLTAAREMSVDIVVEVINDWPPGGNQPLSKSWLKSIAQKGWTGVLAVTTEITPKQTRAFREAGLCLVAIDPPNALDDSLVSVGSTNFIGGTQATNHLIGLGHRADRGCRRPDPVVGRPRTGARLPQRPRGRRHRLRRTR